MKKLTKKFRLVWDNDKKLKLPIEEMQGVTYISLETNTAEFDTLEEAKGFSESNELILPDYS